MDKENIKLISLSDNSLRIMIAPMSMGYVHEEHADDTFKPHRHDYHSLFFLENGYIEMGVDKKIVSMIGPSVLLITPAQVHYPVTMRDITGWVMVFDGKVLDPEVKEIVECIAGHMSTIRIPEIRITFFQSCFLALQQHIYKEVKEPFDTKFLHSLVNTVFYEIVNLHISSNGQSKDNHSSRSLQITQDFKKLVRAQFVKLKRPADYAALLHITVTYLNDVVKSTTGFSTTYFIQQEILGEAHRQLLYTGKTIKEIAHELGYNDPKYFTRLFTKLTGITPLKFRNEEHAQQ